MALFVLTLLVFTYSQNIHHRTTTNAAGIYSADPCSIPVTAVLMTDNIKVNNSPCLAGVIDLFYKNSAGNWELYNNVVPIVRVAL